MVSTRLMSIGGSSSGGESSSAEAGPRAVRSSAPQAASPQHQPNILTISTLPRSNLLPPPKVFTTGLLDMPPEIQEKIFTMLGYKSVAHLRLVCRQFNSLCSSILNSTFIRLQTQMLSRFQAIKAKMPRRESARRNHPLACESDIIETLHMRLCLLQMTFGKHIERKHCCFFPGEILDEVYRILNYLKVTTNLPRPYKITDEIFDLSSMAMEYYKEHIEPNLPEITYFGTEYFDLTAAGAFSPEDSSKYMSMCYAASPPDHGNISDGPEERERERDRDREGNREREGRQEAEGLPPTPPPPQSNMVLRKRIHRIKQGMRRYNNQLTALRTDLRSCKRKTAWQQKQIAEQQKQLAEHQKQTMDYASRLDDYDKKNEEISRKFQTLLQELNKCKTELQYWRSKSPAVATLCGECGAALGHLGPFPAAFNNPPPQAECAESAGCAARAISPPGSPAVAPERSADAADGAPAAADGAPGAPAVAAAASPKRRCSATSGASSASAPKKRRLHRSAPKFKCP